MFYISVSNGLLSQAHFEKMGAAVWQFMWCIDKITKIDEQGWGWVLGGKPIKLSDVPFGSRITTSRNFNELQKQGYINLKHTPYGIIIKVKKAQKRFNKNDKPTLSKVINLRTDIDKPNKIVSVDSNNKTPTASRKDMSWKPYKEPEIDSHTNEYISPPSKIPEKDILAVFALFKDNPAWGGWYKISPQRDAAKRMLEIHGKKKIETAAAFARDMKSEKYALQIRSPYELEQKWKALQDFRDKNGN